MTGTEINRPKPFKKDGKYFMRGLFWDIEYTEFVPDCFNYDALPAFAKDGVYVAGEDFAVAADDEDHEWDFYTPCTHLAGVSPIDPKFKGLAADKEHWDKYHGVYGGYDDEYISGGAVINVNGYPVEPGNR